MSFIKERDIFNKMMQNAMLDFSKADKDIEYNLPMPKVFISEGVQFLIRFFNVNELVSAIARALLTEKVSDEDGDEPTVLIWFYENQFETPSSLGTLGAYLPEWNDAFEYYNDGFSLEHNSLFCDSVRSFEFENVSKLVLCSCYDGEKGSYYLYLPNEAPVPATPKSDLLQVPEIPAEASVSIPF